jgi:hypothetical protein
MTFHQGMRWPGKALPLQDAENLFHLSVESYVLVCDGIEDPGHFVLPQGARPVTPLPVGLCVILVVMNPVVNHFQQLLLLRWSPARQTALPGFMMVGMIMVLTVVMVALTEIMIMVIFVLMMLVMMVIVVMVVVAHGPKSSSRLTLKLPVC